MVKAVCQRCSGWVLWSVILQQPAPAATAQPEKSNLRREQSQLLPASDLEMHQLLLFFVSRWANMVQWLKGVILWSAMYFNTFSAWDDHAGFLRSFHIYLIVLSEAVNKDTITVFRLHRALLCIIHTFPSCFTHSCQSSFRQNSC